MNLHVKVNESQTVRDVLKERHPKGQSADEDSLLVEDGPLAPHPVIIDSITGNSIRTTVNRRGSRLVSMLLDGRDCAVLSMQRQNPYATHWPQ